MNQIMRRIETLLPLDEKWGRNQSDLNSSWGAHECLNKCNKKSTEKLVKINRAISLHYKTGGSDKVGGIHPPGTMNVC